MVNKLNKCLIVGLNMVYNKDKGENKVHHTSLRRFCTMNLNSNYLNGKVIEESIT